jgi:hypothetical protein
MMRNIKRSTSLQSSISSFHFKNENSNIPKKHVSLSLPNSVNEDNSSETEYIPPRPYSRHSSRDIKELLEGPVFPHLLDDDAHKNCPDDSRCILVFFSPFLNELTQFKCAHCKKMGNFLSHSTFTNNLPSYQCILCKLYIHNECLISKCCIIF